MDQRRDLRVRRVVHDDVPRVLPVPHRRVALSARLGRPRGDPGPTAVVAGRLAARLGHRPLLVAGGAVFAASNLWFLARLGAEPAFLATWLPGMLLGGIGVGLVLPALSGAAVASLGPQQFGVGNATNSAIRQIGSAFGAAATVLMVGDPASGLPAFQTVYGALAAGGLLTGLACLPVDTRPRARSA
ncbi:MAG: MFS transporter [Burkholderiaceae bacterium]